MGPNTERACKEFGAIHCVFPAGCAVVAATEVVKIKEHHWDELGMPETLWCNEVKEFGPLIVSIDAQGRNLFEEIKEEDLPFLAESAHADACAPGNPKDASVEDLKDLFRKIMA